MRDFEPQAPLQEPTFLILLSLSSGEKHGYAIMKDVESLSEGRVRLSTGTLYGALNRLLDQGLIVRGGAKGGEDTAREDTAREDAAREDAACEDAAREDAAREDAAREDARGKKTYRLAREGRQVFNAEVSRMQRLVEIAQGAAAPYAAAPSHMA